MILQSHRNATQSILRKRKKPEGRGIKNPFEKEKFARAARYASLSALQKEAHMQRYKADSEKKKAAQQHCKADADRQKATCMQWYLSKPDKEKNACKQRY